MENLLDIFSMSKKLQGLALNNKSIVLNIISGLLSMPAYNYSEEKIAINVAESLDIRCFNMENEKEEYTNAKKHTENLDEKESQEETHTEEVTEERKMRVRHRRWQSMICKR